MSLRIFGVVGALVMGFMVTPGAANAFSETASISEELAHRMHREGIAKMVNPATRKDLKSIVQQAREYADTLDLGCVTGSFFEIRLIEHSRKWIAGYAATLDCEDAPAPLSMYFDVDLKLLSVFEHGA